MDLAVSNFGSNTVSILLGNGDGTFISGASIGVGSAPARLAVADFNGDGVPDLAVPNYGSNTVTILLGNGHGGFFQAVRSPVSVGNLPFAVAAGDLNGDGLPDLAVANRSDNTVSVFLGIGAGFFNSTTTVSVENQPFDVAIADFTGDGKPDLVVANAFSSDVSLVAGNGDGSFGAAQGFSTGTGTAGAFALTIGDYDRNGTPDLAVVNGATSNVSILSNSSPASNKLLVNFDGITLAGTGGVGVANRQVFSCAPFDAYIDVRSPIRLQNCMLVLDTGPLFLGGGTAPGAGSPRLVEGPISGSGDVSGRGVTIEMTGQDDWGVTGNNSYTGETAILTGSLDITSASALGNSSDIVIGDGASLAVSPPFGQTVVLTQPIFLTGNGPDGKSGAVASLGRGLMLAGSVTLDSDSTISGTTLAGQVNLNGFNLTLAGDVENTTATNAVTGTVNGPGSVIEAGGRLSGTGTINAPLSVSAGFLSPGGDPGPGILHTGPTTLEPGTVFRAELDGPTAGSDYAQLVASGPVNLNGSTLLAQLGFNPTAGTTFRIIQSTGAISGVFEDLSGNVLPDGATLTITGRPFIIHYVNSPDGGSVDLTTGPGSETVRFWQGGHAGTDGKFDWSIGQNWVGGQIPNPGDDLVFPTTAAESASTNDFAAGTVFHSIVFTGSATSLPPYQLDGNPVALQDGIHDQRDSLDFFNASVINFSGLLPGITLIGDQTFSCAPFGNSIDIKSSIALGGFVLTLDTGPAGRGATEAGNVFFPPGTIEGTISGDGSLVKNGKAEWVLSGHNAYTGLTTINAGELTIEQPDGLGTADAGTIVNTGASLIIGAPGGLNNSLSLAEPLTINGTGATYPDFSMGAVTLFTSSYTLTGQVTLGSDSTILLSPTSDPTGRAILGDVISTNGHALTFNGPVDTTVLQGATIGGGGRIIHNGEDLSGTGVIDTAVTVGQGSLTPGSDGTGTLTTGSITFMPGTSFEANLSGSGITQLAVNGTVDLSEHPVLDATLPDFTAPASHAFTLVQSTGTITGQFMDRTGRMLTDGSTVNVGGQNFVIRYFNGTPGPKLGLGASNPASRIILLPPPVLTSVSASFDPGTESVSVFVQIVTPGGVNGGMGPRSTPSSGGLTSTGVPVPGSVTLMYQRSDGLMVTSNPLSLADGAATDRPNLPPGVYTVTASYAPDPGDQADYQTSQFSTAPFTAGQAPAITSLNQATFVVDAAGSFQVVATGSPTPALHVSGTLPSGLSFNPANGVLSGTPTDGTAGSYMITFTADNGATTIASQSFTLLVDQAPAITSNASAGFAIGTAGSFSVTASGFPRPVLSESGALPSGLTFDPANQTLAGTPAAGTEGTYQISFVAHNGIEPDASQNFTLTVKHGIAITSPSQITFTVGKNDSFTVTAAGAPAPSISESGSLPRGVSFNQATATLSGTPAAGTAGTYNLTFTAHNGVAEDGVQSFVLMVNDVPVITSPDHVTFSVGTASVFKITTSGSPPPSLSESGTLPSGVTFDPTTATLSGTPAPGTVGVYDVTITAHNNAGDNVQHLELTVAAPPVPPEGQLDGVSTSAGPVLFAISNHSVFERDASGWHLVGLNFVESISATADGSGNPVLFATTQGHDLFLFEPMRGLVPTGLRFIKQLSATTDAAGNVVVFAITDADDLFEYGPTIGLVNTGLTAC